MYSLNAIGMAQLYNFLEAWIDEIIPSIIRIWSMLQDAVEHVFYT
jgi:hypothetical protein